MECELIRQVIVIIGVVCAGPTVALLIWTHQEDKRRANEISEAFNRVRSNHG